MSFSRLSHARRNRFSPLPLHHYCAPLQPAPRRIDRLPTATLPIFNGSGPPAAGEQIESVQVYKNGGVGALGQMGSQDAAVRAERWAWVAVTRKEGEMRTYINGRL